MPDSPEFTWAVILMALGLGLIVMELFIPSGGVIGFFAALAILSSIVLAFWHGPATGTAFLVFTVIAFPILSALMLRWWPNTPMGRRIISSLPEGDSLLPKYEGLSELIGRVGTAKNVMLPSGTVLVDGRFIDAVSEGMPIEAGQAVRVVQVRGNRIVVRPTDSEPGCLPGQATSNSEPACLPGEATSIRVPEQPQTAAADPSRDADDLLSRPADTLGIEPLDDPLA